MTEAFASLRPGDKLQLPNATYVASGRMSLRSPDGTVWSEWLLSPVGTDPATAIRSFAHRWLVLEEGVGLTLWSPEHVSSSFSPASVSGNSLDIAGRTYSVNERDTMQVVAIVGDVGGDASLNERFDYVDLVSGLLLMTVEWNARGLDVSIGRRIAGSDLVNWARIAGNDLLSRQPTGSLATRLTTNRTTDDGRPASAGVWGVVSLLAVALIAWREFSGSDQDCTQQLNPVTHKMETVCTDSLRSRGGRTYGGWGGK